MQDPAGLTVQELALDQTLSLEFHQPPGNFGAGLGIDKPFPTQPGQFDLLLGIKPPFLFGA